jgi:hypothetical protein
LAWWNRCLHLRVGCLIWCPRSFILKSMILSLLRLSNQLPSSCNVSFLKPPCAFSYVPVIFHAIISLLSRFLLKPHWWGTSGFWMNWGYWEGIV